MATQLPIDDELVEAAIRLSGCESHIAAVEVALREYIHAHGGDRDESESRPLAELPPQSGEEWRQRLLNLADSDAFGTELLAHLGIDAASGMDARIVGRLGLISLFGKIDYDPDYDYKAMRYYKAQSYI